jgi:hypothetical protein
MGAYLGVLNYFAIFALLMHRAPIIGVSALFFLIRAILSIAIVITEHF